MKFNSYDVLGIDDTPAKQGVWLIFGAGSTKARAVAVDGERVVIGRDPSCQIRPDSAAVSRMHTSIERRGERVFVHDLGSVNGTFHNGRLLRDEATEAHDGDRIELGPVSFTIAVGSTDTAPAAIDELVMSWLRTEDDDQVQQRQRSLNR